MGIPREKIIFIGFEETLLLLRNEELFIGGSEEEIELQSVEKILKKIHLDEVDNFSIDYMKKFGYLVFGKVAERPLYFSQKRARFKPSNQEENCKKINQEFLLLFPDFKDNIGDDIRNNINRDIFEILKR